MITVPFKCPQCGKEYSLSQIPQGSALFRCENPECKHLFFVNMPSASAQGSQADSAQPALAPVAAPAQAEKESPQAQGGENSEIAKDLAQLYFSNIGDSGASQAPGGGEKKAADSAAADETWFAEEEEISEEVRRQQRQQLFQFAQESAASGQDGDKSQSGHVTKQVRRFLRERHSQRVVFWILLLVICLIPLARVMYGRMTASVEQFSRMQPQIVPSLLYFIAAVILLRHLLRRTNAPCWVTAVLLVIPLIADWWYLFPELLNILSADVWLNISSGSKIFIALLALLMSGRAKRHPALKYKGA